MGPEERGLWRMLALLGGVGYGAMALTALVFAVASR